VRETSVDSNTSAIILYITAQRETILATRDGER